MKKALFIAILLVFCYSNVVFAGQRHLTGLNFIDKDTGFCHYVVYVTGTYKLILKERTHCAEVTVPLVEIPNIRDLITYVEEIELDPPLCYELTAVMLSNGESSDLVEILPCSDVPEHLRKKTISY